MKINAPAPPNIPTYVCASYIPCRSPQWKYHTNLGHAKSSLQTHVHGGVARENMQIWELNESGELELLYSVHYGMPSTDLPWKNTAEAREKQQQGRLKAARTRVKNLKSELDKAEEVLRKLEEK